MWFPIVWGRFPDLDYKAMKWPNHARWREKALCTTCCFNKSTLPLGEAEFVTLEWAGERSNWFPVSLGNVDPDDSIGREFRIIKIVSAWSERVVILLTFVMGKHSFYIWGLKLGAVSPEPGISLGNDLKADHYVLFVINLGLCCFLKGKIMKIPGTCCDTCKYITNSLSLETHQTKSRDCSLE